MPKAPPRFRRRSPDARREQIVAAAQSCLARGGVAAFTVSEIAGVAGISQGLINHYFPSKDALLVATYRAVSDRLKAATQQKLEQSGGTPAGRLRAIVAATFGPTIFVEPYLTVWLALWGQVRGNAALRAAYNELYNDYRRNVAQAIAAHAGASGRRCDPVALARAFTALVDGLWLERCLNPRAMSAAEAKAICLGLLEGALGPLDAQGRQPRLRRAT